MTSTTVAQPDPQLTRFLRSESWRNPEAVEDRVLEQMWGRKRWGLRPGDPDPLDPAEVVLIRPRG